MSNISYHCPNCGSSLKFNPSTGGFHCEYCTSDFNRYDLEDQGTPNNHIEEISEYYCNNCGAHIITDATTVATECYYCHNAVIMQRRLLDNDMPTRIIPFKFNKEDAKASFKKWIFKKSYIPAEFRDDSYIETMQGIYFPYWLVDIDGDISYRGKMFKGTTELRGRKRTNYTSEYRIEKDGQIHMEDITLAGLKTERKKLIEGVQPFDESGMEPFTMTYLAGFQAEQKDIELSEIDNKETLQLFESYAEKKLMSTLEKYATHHKKSFSFHPTKVNWEYSLMPVWVITYKYKGELYHFAMNGQTGKACGRIPVDKPKLFKYMLFAGLVSFTILLILLYFIGGSF